MRGFAVSEAETGFAGAGAEGEAVALLELVDGALDLRWLRFLTQQDMVSRSHIIRLQEGSQHYQFSRSCTTAFRRARRMARSRSSASPDLCESGRVVRSLIQRATAVAACR